MGHRTLVAYDRDGYDLHYAHWGVSPADLTPETPFGGPPNDGWAREQVSLSTPEGGRLTDGSDRAVDADPIATALSFAEIGEHVDPVEHEALYVVDSEFSVRTYLVWGFDARPVGRTEGPTVALVGYDGESDATYLRGWRAGACAARSVCGPDRGAMLKALRWLEPERGTVVWMAGRERSECPDDASGDCMEP